MTSVKSQLVDARNVNQLLPEIRKELAETKLVGFDIETQDRNRHEGLNHYNNATRLVFDHRRATITGFSTYADGSDTAYYFNMAHADEENRLPEGFGIELITAINPAAITVAHNAPFEIVHLESCWGAKLQNIVCTLQMAVSHHGPDEYDLTLFDVTPLPVAFHAVAREVISAFEGWSPGQPMNGVQQELLGKFIAKESKAAHSWNGFVDSISKGYNLKKLTKMRFGYEQMDFKKLLAIFGAQDMGDLTGEQVCSYGADDAYWAVQHYNWMLDEMLRTNPHALQAFFKQENPMVHVYADNWRDGIRLDLEQVFDQRASERVNMAKTLREFKAQVKQMLPFPDAPNEILLRKEKWYSGKDGLAWQKKRKQIIDWANTPDEEDDFKQCFQVSNPIGNAWAEEKATRVPTTGKLNLVYYMGMRTLMYDLMGVKVEYSEGSVASDKEARGRIRERLDGLLPKDKMPLDVRSPEEQRAELQMAMMANIQAMADIEQRVKLYLTPYTQLLDPETSRVYPSLSSKLATRRLAMSFPNAMQLAKSGDSAYIRSFYLGDSDDHVVVSADWSAIELVLIGDQSGDPGFAKVYGTIPYGDMHSGAAVDALCVKTLPGLTDDEFKEFKFGRNPNNRRLLDFSGKELTPSDYHKFARGTAIGKGVNFSYWYSGALSTVASNLNLSDDQHWELVENYRNRFPLAEQWRVGVQEQASISGYVTLPDGHRRTKYEATRPWALAMESKFQMLSASPALMNYASTAIRRLQGRARNQVVNSMIQGTCATLAKRSLLNLIKLCADAGMVQGFAKDWRMMMPIHDELVFSVHKDAVMKFIPLLRQAMTTHPDIVQTLPLHCTVAIGRTFRPFNKADPRMSQIELDEAQMIEGVVDKELEGKVLPDHKVQELLEWMYA
jgi:DNA polymerase I-like protein with 3'-5' exonuclease and polymerase domains